MSEILQIDFNPSSVAWIGGLQARVVQSPSPRLRERYKSWTTTDLGEIALAIATRLAIIMRVEDRLRNCCSALVREIEESGKLETHLTRNTCYEPSDQGLSFDICAATDSCLFEWKALYEVLAKFATTFGRRILGIRIKGSQIDSIIEQAGVPAGWISLLRDDRNWFAHQNSVMGCC
jgi:hypothetical protein